MLRPRCDSLHSLLIVISVVDYLNIFFTFLDTQIWFVICPLQRNLYLMVLGQCQEIICWCHKCVYGSWFQYESNVSIWNSINPMIKFRIFRRNKKIRVFFGLRFLPTTFLGPKVSSSKVLTKSFCWIPGIIFANKQILILLDRLTKSFCWIPGIIFVNKQTLILLNRL